MVFAPLLQPNKQIIARQKDSGAKTNFGKFFSILLASLYRFIATSKYTDYDQDIYLLVSNQYVY